MGIMTTKRPLPGSKSAGTLDGEVLRPAAPGGSREDADMPRIYQHLDDEALVKHAQRQVEALP